VIAEVVSVVDHTKFVPVVVNVDVPQLSTTVTTGAEGKAKTSTLTFDEAEQIPGVVYVTV